MGNPEFKLASELHSISSTERGINGDFSLFSFT
jgi:hypothetical protein